MYEGLKNLEVPRSPKHPRARRVGRMGLIALLVFAVLAIGGGGYVYWRVKHEIGKGVDERLGDLADAAPGEPFNILVIGSDSREGVTRKDRAQGLGGPGGRRADVIQLLHVGGEGKKSTLVSIPRDLRVEIPEHGTTKINAAYAYGEDRSAARKLLIKTVEQFTGLEINHVVDINFFGFRGIVNAVGGVPIRVSREIHDDKAKLDIPRPGCWVLNGDQALAYVRARQFDPTADIGRINRQQGFLRALAGSVGPSIAFRWDRVVRIAGEIGDNVAYDRDFVGGVTFDRARAVAARLASSDPRKLDFRIVPNYSAFIGGISYLIPLEGQMSALFDALRRDAAPPPVGLTSQSVPRKKDVSIQVLNGTSRDGLAARHSARLSKRGFRVLTPGNVDNVKRTVILFNENDALKAELVKQFFKGARLQLTSDFLPADVVVTIGRDVLDTSSPTPSTPASSPDAKCRKLPA